MNVLRHRNNRLFFIAASMVILVVATLLRTYHIADRSLWLDEAKAANHSRGTLWETIENTRQDNSSPFVYPFILYVVQKIDDGPFAVRLPSLIASVLAVALMLATVHVGIPASVAIFCALLLAVSDTQIRYAQEVREYSLSVLFAALLLFAFLYRAHISNNRSPSLLFYASLFCAPFVQYGLVLFSLGTITATAVIGLIDNRTGLKMQHAVFGLLYLGVGGILSFAFTLRYQLHIIDAQAARGHYFDPGIQNALLFFARSTYHLFSYILSGDFLLGLILVGLALYAHGMVNFRKPHSVAVVAFTSLTMVVVASFLHKYPYGGIRQCLFMAPVLCLTVGLSLGHVLNCLVQSHRNVATIAIVLAIVVGGALNIWQRNPYAEQENIKSVLKELMASIKPHDQVYIYYGAKAALKFYKIQDDRFIYGSYHRDKPEEFLPELQRSVKPETNRLWLVFSHFQPKIKEVIFSGLSPSWRVRQIVSARGAALYLTNRREGGDEVQ